MMFCIQYAGIFDKHRNFCDFFLQASTNMDISSIICILYTSYEVGNGSRHTPSGVPEMLDTPPSHMISTKKTASLQRSCIFSNSKFLFQIFFLLVVHHLVFQPQHRKRLLQIFFCIFFHFNFCHIPAKLVGLDVMPI